MPSKKVNNLYDLNIERAVLSIILNHYDNISFLIDDVSEEDFYFNNNREIYKTISKMHTKRMHVDPISVCGDNADLNLKNYINEIQSYIANPAKLEDYISILRANRVKREASFLCQAITDKLGSKDVSEDEVLEMLNLTCSRVGDISSIRNQKTKKIEVLGDEVLNEIEQGMGLNNDGIIGLSTGIWEIDEATGGLCGGDLIILAARPSMGKTALAINTACSISLNYEKDRGGPVSVFSLEMDAKQLLYRMYSEYSQVPLKKIRGRTLNSVEFEKVKEAKRIFKNDRFFINDSTCVTLNMMRTTLRKQKREHGISAAVIDYVQLMSSDSKRANNRSEDIAEITRGLKQLAKELDIPIIALSQLNRGLESRVDKRPMMSDLRESGAIEQDADVIMFIYRDFVYNKEPGTEYDAEIILAKVRNGALKTVNLTFSGETTTFQSRVAGKKLIGKFF